MSLLFLFIAVILVLFLMGVGGALDVSERVCMSWASSLVVLGVAFLLAVKVLVMFSVF